MNNKPVSYTLTNDSINLVWNGKMVSSKRGDPNFLALRSCLIEERWSDVEKHITIGRSLEAWAKGRFTLKGETFFYDGKELPQTLNSRIISMATSGAEPQPLFNFWERLQRNPSFRSVQQLYTFLQHLGIPLTKDGCFLAYKGVRSDFRDVHSGKFDNSPGAVHKMPRNQISDDPNLPCHEGFHVGSEKYATGFGPRTVICKVDPEHVVCVPYDSSNEKMRVCEYRVLGVYSGQLPSDLIEDTVVDEDNLPLPIAAAKSDSAMPDYEPEYDDEDEDDEDDDRDDEVESESSDEPEESPTRAAPKARVRHKFDNLEYDDLLKQTLDDLRKYAANNRRIVGASKIGGGKVALVAAILKDREQG